MTCVVWVVIKVWLRVCGSWSLCVGLVRVVCVCVGCGCSVCGHGNSVCGRGYSVCGRGYSECSCSVLVVEAVYVNGSVQDLRVYFYITTKEHFKSKKNCTVLCMLKLIDYTLRLKQYWKISVRYVRVYQRSSRFKVYTFGLTSTLNCFLSNKIRRHLMMVVLRS